MRRNACDAVSNSGILVMALGAVMLTARAAEIIPAPLPQPLAAATPGAGSSPVSPVNKPDPNDGRCDVCGSCRGIRKVCVPKAKEREVKKICWSYKCEDFCVPGPSVYCGKMCDQDACGCWSHDVWQPTCAEVRTKKVPVKTEVKRKVPGVEWTPEERCAACRCQKSRETRPAATPAPDAARPGIDCLGGSPRRQRGER